MIWCFFPVSKEILLGFINNTTLLEEEIAKTAKSPLILTCSPSVPNAHDRAEDFIDFKATDSDTGEFILCLEKRVLASYYFAKGDRFECAICGAVVSPEDAVQLHVVQDLLGSFLRPAGPVELPKTESPESDGSLEEELNVLNSSASLSASHEEEQEVEGAPSTGRWV